MSPNRKSPSSIPALSDAVFQEKFDLLIDRLWTIQDRIGEVKEFEKQWKSLFDGLKERTGRDCKINIANPSVYRSFHWDRYQVLLSDLLSLFENELDDANESSVLRQSIHHLRLLSVNEYIDPNYRANFIFNPRHPLTEDEKKRRLEELRLESAREREKHTKEALKQLFPRITDDFRIRDQDIHDLFARLSSMAKEIRGIRHYFNHKYEEVTTARYEGALKNFDLEKVTEIVNKLFDIAAAFGFVKFHSSYGKNDFDYQPEVSDQLDLILFGFIKGAIYRFYENQDKDIFYWEARKRYFESDAIFEILSPESKP